jgi:hypothetical protein
MLAQEARQRLGQMLRQARGVGEEMHARPHSAGKAGEIAAHGIDLVHDDAGMVEQAFAGGGQLHAATAALEQGNAERLLEALDPRARRSQRQVRPLGAAGDAALVSHRDEELEVNEVETQLRLLG